MHEFIHWADIHLLVTDLMLELLHEKIALPQTSHSMTATTERAESLWKAFDLQ